MKIQKALLASGVTFFFYLSGFFVLWTPLPLFYLGLTETKATWRLALLLLCLFALFFYLHLLIYFVEPIDIPRIRFLGLSYFYFYLMASLFLSLSAWKRWSWVDFGLRGGLALTAILWVSGFLVQHLNLFDLQGLIASSVQGAQELLEQIGQQPQFRKDQETTLSFLAQMKVWITFFPKLLPALIFIFVLIVGGFNIGTLKLFRKAAPYLQSIGDFKKLSLPHGCLWFLLLAGVCYFSNEYFLHTSWLKVLSLNVALASLFLYFLQGLSILAYWIRRFSPLFRLGIYGLVVLFLQIIGLVLVGLGIADVWLNLRKLK